jgi:hypothetical protein
VGEVFVVKFFTGNESKLNPRVFNNGENHKLEDSQGTSLHQTKSSFANLLKKITSLHVLMSFP